MIRDQDLCSLKTQKGRLGEYSFSALDYVGPCRGEECPIATECNYWINNSRIATCRVEAGYLKAIYENFKVLMELVPDPFIMQWIGSHMIKLYHQLIKMQIEEMSIRGRISYMEKTGKISIHPVFKEQRDIIKAIRSEWKDSGLQELAKQHGFLGVALDPKAAKKIASGKPGAGDPGFYDCLKK